MSHVSSEYSCVGVCVYVYVSVLTCSAYRVYAHTSVLRRHQCFSRHSVHVVCSVFLAALREGAGRGEERRGREGREMGVGWVEK